MSCAALWAKVFFFSLTAQWRVVFLFFVTVAFVKPAHGHIHIYYGDKRAWSGILLLCLNCFSSALYSTTAPYLSFFLSNKASSALSPSPSNKDVHTNKEQRWGGMNEGERPLQIRVWEKKNWRNITTGQGMRWWKMMDQTEESLVNKCRTYLWKNSLIWFNIEERVLDQFKNWPTGEVTELTLWYVKKD